MEKELKTLKDLKIIDCYCNETASGEGIRGFFRESELKAEAVKWVKEIKERRDNGQNDISLVNLGKMNRDGEGDYPEDYLTNYSYETSDYSGAIKWIKHFFNLTESDLK